MSSLFSFGGSDKSMFESPKPITPQEYEFIRQTVYEYSRINLGPSKKELVMARLSKRLRALKIPAYKDYIDLLRSPQGKDEMTNLIDSISTNHTYFFREIQHFNFLVETILPDVCKAGSGMSKTFRVWSAATSSGEEPYSIALVLEEYLKTKAQGWNWHIQCTDISTRILKKAQEGIFVKERLDKIRKDWLSKYFEKGHGEFDGQFRVKADLKRNMSFTCLNLLSPSYPFRESYNVIFCRNVMIYFDRPTQEELVSKLEKLLLPGGYLMIGHAESLTAIKHNLKMIKPAIYRKPL